MCLTSEQQQLKQASRKHVYLPSEQQQPSDKHVGIVLQVAVVPGEAFGAPACVRISYAASLETLGKAMDRIVKALDTKVYTRRA